MTGTRVISTGPTGPKVEVSVQQAGKLLGKDTTTMITYTSSMRPDGLLLGEGSGIISTPDGDIATFNGSGIGKPTGKGMAVRFRGALYYSTPSKALARLNDAVGIFEFDVDENGNTSGKVWEWK